MWFTDRSLALHCASVSAGRGERVWAPSPAFGAKTSSAFSLVVAIVFSCLTAVAAHAGDTAQVGFTGFDASGKIFVLEEFGIAGGSGQPYVHLFFVDVDGNRELFPAIRARGKQNAFGGRSVFARESGLLTLRAKNWAYAERQAETRADLSGLAAAAPLKLWAGPRLVSEATGDRRQVVAFGPKLKGEGKGAAKRRFEVTMATRNLAPEQLDAAGCAPYAFEVAIFDHKTKKKRTLLDEKRPKASRSCTIRAEVVGVWVARGRVAVVLSYDVTGFEGPDTRHFVVGGRVP